MKIWNMDNNYRLLLETINDHAVFLLTKEGRITYANRAIEQVTGYSPDELTNQHFSAFYLSKGDGADQILPLKEATERGFFKEVSCQSKKDGTVYWAHLSLQKIINDGKAFDGFTGRLDNQTEHQVLVSQSIERDERFRLLVETVKDYGIFLLDTEGYITSWNEGANGCTDGWTRHHTNPSDAIRWRGDCCR